MAIHYRLKLRSECTYNFNGDSLWTHVAGSTVQQHTHQSLLLGKWGSVEKCTTLCAVLLYMVFFSFFWIMQFALIQQKKKKRIMEFARFIEFVGVIKAEALSKHTLHVKVWWFHNYQKIGPSPRECSVQISQLFWFFWSPLTSLIINYCTPVRFSFFLFLF